MEFGHIKSDAHSQPASHTRTGSSWPRRRIGIPPQRCQSARVTKWSMPLAVALLLSSAGLIAAQTLTNVADVLALSPEQLAKVPLVRLRGVVTYYKSAGSHDLIV